MRSFHLYRNKRCQNQSRKVYENALSDDLSINQAYGTEPHPYACTENAEQDLFMNQAYGMNSGNCTPRKISKPDDRSFDKRQLTDMHKHQRKGCSEQDDDMSVNCAYETDPHKGNEKGDSEQDNGFINQIYETMDPYYVQPGDIISIGNKGTDSSKAEHIYDFPAQDTIC